MTAIAAELGKRTTARHLAHKAREKAVDQTKTWARRAASSPALPVVGGILGALLGLQLARAIQRTFGRSSPAPVRRTAQA